MPRGVSSSIITELDKAAFEAPIYAVRIVREAGTLYWAERTVTIDGQAYEARLDGHDGVEFSAGTATQFTITALNVDGAVTILDRAESFAGCRCELLEYMPTLDIYSVRSVGYLDEITELTDDKATIPASSEHTGSTLVGIPKRSVSASCPHHFANTSNYVNERDFEGSECPYQRVGSIGFGAALLDALDAVTDPVTFLVSWDAGLDLAGGKFKATDKIRIDSEVMLVTAADDVDLNGDQEITVVRGYGGTSLAVHSASPVTYVYFANCQFSDSACIRRGMFGNNPFDTFGGTPRNYFGGFPIITGTQWGFFRSKQGEKPNYQRLSFSGNESAYGLALCVPYGKVRLSDPILVLAIGEGDFLTTFWAVSEGLLATNATDDSQTTRINAYSGGGTQLYVNGVARHDSNPGFGIEQWNGQMDQSPPASLWFPGDYPDVFNDFFLGFNGTAWMVLRINQKNSPGIEVEGKQITGAFTVEYGRVVRVYTSVSPITYTRKATTNPAWVAFDIRTAKRIGAGVDPDRMNIQSYIDVAAYNSATVTTTDEEEVGTVPRWTFNGAFDQRRPFAEWERLVCLGMYCLPPFIGADGTYKIKSLKAVTLAGLPVLSSLLATDARNILWEPGEDGVERSSLVRLRKSILEIPNQISVNFIDKAAFTKLTVIVADRDAQEALGRKLGDQSRRVIEKSYSLPGTSTMEEAARWATLVLRAGEFAEGGLSNNNGVKFKMFYRSAVNLELGDVVEVQDSKLDTAQGEQYYRITRIGDESFQVNEGGFLYVREIEAWIHNNDIYDDGAFTVTHFERLNGPSPNDIDLMNGPTPTIDNVNGKEFDLHFTIPTDNAATFFEYSIYGHTSDTLPTAITEDTGTDGVVIAGISKLTDLTKSWTTDEWALNFDIVLFDTHRGSLSPLTRTFDYEAMFIVCQIVTNTATEITFNAPGSQVRRTMSGMEYYIVERGVGNHFWEQLAFTTPAIVDESITISDPSQLPGTRDRTVHMSSSAPDLWVWVACYNDFGQGRVTATPATISYSGGMPAGAIDIMAITDGRDLGGLVNARKLMISSGGMFATIQHDALGQAQYADSTTKGMYRLLDHGHVNVKDYGARGDGSSDDTSALDIAWSVVQENGGGRLFFPAGTYRTSSNVVFSVIGSTPQGCHIEGIPGASIIKPDSGVTIAVTLATQVNTDGYCNSLKMSGIRLDGVNTSGKTGILIGENAGDLSAGIGLEDVEVLRFAGSGGKGIEVRNLTGGSFTRVYIGRCGTNLHIEGADAGNALPTTLIFEHCKFREAKSSTGGTGRGVVMVQAFKTSFRHCLFEANDKEGLYCVPGSATNNVLVAELDECWFEGNQAAGAASSPPVTTDYEIKLDGTSAGTVMFRLANLYFNSSCRSIYIQTAFNCILDNVYPRSSANSVVIGNNCQGNILNWPENNVNYATAVSNSSPVSFGAQFHAPATANSTFKSVGAATFLSTVSVADTILGLQGADLNLFMQPGASSSGIVAIRDYLGSNIANANTNRFAMDKRFVMALGTVTAANDLTLPLTGNVFTVTGNTQINAITTANWQAGPIYLVFSGTPTVKHNTAGGAGTSPILLAGSVDFAAASNRVLTLVYDGANWQEVARKVP
jgi:Pectate lyase superfamily protein